MDVWVVLLYVIRHVRGVNSDSMNLRVCVYLLFINTMHNLSLMYIALYCAIVGYLSQWDSISIFISILCWIWCQPEYYSIFIMQSVHNFWWHIGMSYLSMGRWIFWWYWCTKCTLSYNLCKVCIDYFVLVCMYALYCAYIVTFGSMSCAWHDVHVFLGAVYSL